MTESLLTTEQVAERLNLTTYTIRQYIKQYRESNGEEGLHALKVGREYRIPESSLNEFLNKN